MFLLVKAQNAEMAKQYALQRGLNTYKCYTLGVEAFDRFCVFTVDNADSERIISHWFTQDSNKPEPGKGYPYGTLLWYREE